MACCGCKDIQLTEAWEAAATGPSVLTELFQWPEHATATLWAQRGEGGTTAAAVAMDNLTKFHSLQLIMTSDFSGMGTAELAVEMALDAVAQHLHARHLELEYRRHISQLHHATHNSPDNYFVILLES